MFDVESFNRDRETVLANLAQLKQAGKTGSIKEFHDALSHLKYYPNIESIVEVAIKQMYVCLEVFENYQYKMPLRDLFDWNIDFYHGQTDDQHQTSHNQMQGYGYFLWTISAFMKAIDRDQPYSLRIQAVERAIIRSLFAIHEETMYQQSAEGASPNAVPPQLLQPIVEQVEALFKEHI